MNSVSASQWSVESRTITEGTSMAKYTQRIHTLDLNHKPSVRMFLQHLKEEGAKVSMYHEPTTVNSIISVVTKFREKDTK
jgi:hypothetical protein